MLRNRLLGAVAVAGLIGLTACAGDETPADDADVVAADTMIEPDTTTVEVPVTVPDTTVAVTTVDTSTDTVDIGPR
ncbi:MAG TPA: hypothetical protein VFI96_06725 [Longimicrobiaceae bacterium]|nr:hypothetical protein [Longimicrobiaceae bacterium]